MVEALYDVQTNEKRAEFIDGGMTDSTRETERMRGSPERSLESPVSSMDNDHTPSTTSFDAKVVKYEDL